MITEIKTKSEGGKNRTKKEPKLEKLRTKLTNLKEMESKQTPGMISREKRTEETQRLTEPQGVQNQNLTTSKS